MNIKLPCPYLWTPTNVTKKHGEVGENLAETRGKALLEVSKKLSKINLLEFWSYFAPKLAKLLNSHVEISSLPVGVILYQSKVHDA